MWAQLHVICVKRELNINFVFSKSGMQSTLSSLMICMKLLLIKICHPFGGHEMQCLVIRESVRRLLMALAEVFRFNFESAAKYE